MEERTKPILTIENLNEVVLQIEDDGTIRWMKNGKWTECTSEKELAGAFGRALQVLRVVSELNQRKDGKMIEDNSINKHE